MRIIWFFIGFALLGCKDIEVRKVSEEEIFREEMNHIDWKKVDSYPSFKACEEGMIFEEDKKLCFITKLADYILQSLSKNETIMTDSIREKVVLTLEISPIGEPKIVDMQIPEELEEKVENINSWLEAAVAELPKIYPAEKRGVPVATTFRLPLMVEAN